MQKGICKDCCTAIIQATFPPSGPQFRYASGRDHHFAPLRKYRRVLEGHRG